MKKNILGFLLLSTIILSGCSLNQNVINKQKSDQTQDQNIANTITESQKKLNDEWNQIKNSEKFKQCYRSKKDFDKNKNEILSKYKEVLNKETNNIKLTIEDEYIKYIYEFLNYRSSDFSIIEEIANLSSQINEEKITRTQSLLNYLYCPDVQKIPISYPLTSDGCIEILSTSMQPFEFPERKNYQIEEEYSFAIKKINDNKIQSKKSNYDCCYKKNIGAGCAKVIYFLNSK